MGIVRKETSWNTISLFLGTFIGAVNTMLLFPLFLTQEQYGLTRILAEVSILAGQIAMVGTPSLLLKFMPEFRKEKADSSGVLTFVIRVSLLGFIIVSAILFFAHDLLIKPYENNAELFIEYYFLLYPMVVFTIINALLSYYARSVYKSIFQLFAREVVVRLAQTILVVFYIWNYINFNQFVYGFVFVHALSGLLVFVYLVRAKELTVLDKKKKVKHGRATVFRFIKYSFANFLTGIASSLSNRIDMLMLSAMVGAVVSGNQGLKATAIYALASYVVATIEMPARALGNIALSLVAKAWHENDIATIKMLYHKSALNQFVAGLLIYVLIIVNIDYAIEFIKGVSGNDYSLAKSAVVYLGMAKLFHVASGVNGGIIMTSKYYYIGTLMLIFLAVLTFLLNYLLIPVYEIKGAAIATAITILVYDIAAFLFLRVKFKIQPYTPVFLLVLLIGAISFSVHFLPDSKFWLTNLLYKSILISIIYISLVYIFKVSEDLNEIINKWLKKFGVLKNLE